MNITIESTSKLVELDIGGARVPARVWQGRTESGVPVHCYITRIVPEIRPDDPRQSEFERELAEQAAPRRIVDAIPARMLLG